MQSILLGFLVVLCSLCLLEAAPSKNKEVNQPKAEQLVRVYPINEEQYERLLKLTDGKHVISEGRLTSAGFRSVRNTLDSGWNSLLRIMGLTTNSRSEVTEIDIDAQPLCVMQRSISDDFESAENEPRSLEARAANEDDSLIHCIVVLKREPELDSSIYTNPSFAPYFYHENSSPVDEQQELPQAPQHLDQQAVELATLFFEQTNASEEKIDRNKDVRQLTTKTNASDTVRRKNTELKSKPTSKHSRRPAVDAAYFRQYGSPYAPPSPYGGGSYPYGGGYGSPFGGSYPYGGNANFGQYSPYGQQYGYGPQLPYAPQPPYYPQQYYGQYPAYPYPHYEENEDEDADEDEEDENEAAANYRDNYYN